MAGEEEVLFPPLSRFKVARVQKKLLPMHVRPGAAPGGFPDEVLLVAPDAEVAEAVPQELKLKVGYVLTPKLSCFPAPYPVSHNSAWTAGGK
eukprot:COSAG04_NODE_3746_length_2561_cov_4.391552_6_plen_92_part_00